MIHWIVIIAIVSWWIADGSNIIQFVKFMFKMDRLRPFDCPKCLGFWLGLIYSLILITDNGFNLVFLSYPILISSLAMFIEKLFKLIR